MKKFAALIGVIALFVACSSVERSLPMTNASGAMNALSREDAGGTAIATFTIQWPAPTKTSRRRTFISPKAESLIIEVNPDASKPTPFTIANNPGTGAASTITLRAPLGIDRFVFSLWDTPQKRGETTSAGNELGQAELPHKKILAQSKNVLHVTIDGITASVTAAPLANQMFVESDAQTGGYDLVGHAPALFALTAYDAAGAVIVPPGAPTYELDASVNSRAYLKIARIKGKPNEFTVQEAALNQATNSLALVPTAIDATGVSKTQGPAVPISTRSAIYVSYASGNASKVAVFDDFGNALAFPPTAFGGLQDPTAMIYDTRDGRIFVADSGLGKIEAFDTHGNAETGFTAPVLSGANGLAYAADLNRIYASGAGSVIAFRPSTGTTITLSKGAFAKTAQPQSIAYVASAHVGGPFGVVVRRVVLGNQGTFSLDYYDDRGTYVQSNAINASFETPAPPAPVRGLLFDDQLQFFPTIFAGGGASGGGFLINQSPSGFDDAGTPIVSSTTSYAGIAIDPALNGIQGIFPGEIFVAEPGANVVQGMGDGTFTAPDSHVIQAPTSAGLGQPQGIAIVY